MQRVAARLFTGIAATNSKGLLKMKARPSATTFRPMVVFAFLALAACAGSSTPSLAPGASVQSVAVHAEKNATSSCLPSPCIYASTSGVEGQRSQVLTFAGNATGNVEPLGRTTGSRTQLNGPQGIAVDSSYKLYVTNASGGQILVYAAGGYGNAKPIARITGASTGLSYAQKIAVDASGNMYVANSDNGSSSPSVTVYAAGANGNATPLQTIAGANTGLSEAYGIAVDNTNQIYVTNVSNSSVTVYAAGSNGNVTPEQTISGSNTGLHDPVGIALDASGDMYVANTNDSVTVYATGANGNVTPIRTITGNMTKLDSPRGVAIDATGNIYVANGSNSSSVTVYAPGTKKNVKPIQTIKGKKTKLNGTYAWAIAVR
ncbi:MAG TPA: NHL repeat-containing protein [Candidatus Tumulicola sp.]|jgi:6-phosphogluconolactonase (cycloisomerase 2 family)